MDLLDISNIDVELHRFARLVILLEDWAEWMRGYSPVRGYSNHTVGLSNGYGSSTTFEDMCESSDSIVCKAIDAELDSLVPSHRAAINRRYGVASVFRFPRMNYADCLIQAHEQLIERLPKRGVAL